MGPAPSPFDTPDDEDLFWQGNFSSVIQAISAAVLVIITAFYTYFAALQWEAIEESVKISRVSAEIARRSADIALAEQRAWLLVSSIELSGELSVTEAPRITMLILNTGNTPALRVRHTIEPMIAGNQDLLSTAPVGAPTGPDRLIPPGTSGLRLFTPIRHTLTPEEMGLYLQRRIQLYIRVILQYEDIWGEEHTTEYCSYHLSGDERHLFFLCDQYNHMS